MARLGAQLEQRQSRGGADGPGLFQQVSEQCITWTEGETLKWRLSCLKSCNLQIRDYNAKICAHKFVRMDVVPRLAYF